MLVFFIVLLASPVFVRGTPLDSYHLYAGCGFHITASNGYNGSIGQLPSGQVRAGSNLTPSLFTWFGDAFTDQLGRGCWWTPPTLVLQCDWNQQPSHGFGIGCYGGVSYKGQSLFYKCQTGDGDEVNIYLQPKGSNCSRLTLQADGCRPPCAGPGASSLTRSTSTTSSSPNPSLAPLEVSTSLTEQGPSPGIITETTPSVSTATLTSTPTSRPTSTPGPCSVVIAQGPNQIILIDKGNPDTAYGPNPDMTVRLSPNISTIFIFQFTASASSNQCALMFGLPPVQQQQIPPYTLTGAGPVSFALLSALSADSSNTTYDNAPGVAMPLEAVSLESGMSTQPLTFPCPGSDAHIVIAMRDEPGSDVCLEYRQYSAEVLVGLYLIEC